MVNQSQEIFKKCMPIEIANENSIYFMYDNMNTVCLPKSMQLNLAACCGFLYIVYPWKLIYVHTKSLI